MKVFLEALRAAAEDYAEAKGRKNQLEEVTLVVRLDPRDGPPDRLRWAWLATWDHYFKGSVR